MPLRLRLRGRLFGNKAATAVDLDTTIVTDLGGDARVLAFYDARSGITTGAGPTVTQWADRRGGGFGPTLIGGNDRAGNADAASSPTWDSAAKKLTTSATRWMFTNETGAFNLSTAKTIYVVGTISGTINHATDSYPFGLHGAGGRTLFANCTGGSSGAISIASAYAGGQSSSGPSSSIRVWRLTTGRDIASFHGGGIDCVARGRTNYEADVVSGFDSSTDTIALCLGRSLGASGVCTDTFQAIIVLEGGDEAEDFDLVQAWAVDQFAATVVADKPLVLCDGNSITSGQGTIATPATNAWPAKMKALGNMATADVLNFGYSGRTGTTIDANADWRVDSMITSARTAKSVYVFFEITNDVQTGKTNAQIQTALAAMAAARKAAGWNKVIVPNCLPRSGDNPASVGTVGYYRAQVNAWLAVPANLVAAGIDGTVDLAGNANLSNPDDTTYYSDGIHPTIAGHTVIAGLIETAVLAALA